MSTPVQIPLRAQVFLFTYNYASGSYTHSPISDNLSRYLEKKCICNNYNLMFKTVGSISRLDFTCARSS